MRIQKLLLPALAIVLSLSTRGADLPLVDPARIEAKYGKPDVVKSTEYDKPRPPLVTRMLEYKKEHVRFTLLADGPVGAPPPYARWRLIGFQDPRDNSVISGDEVERRMRARKNF